MTEFIEGNVRTNIKKYNPNAKKPPPPLPVKLVIRCVCGKIIKQEKLYETVSD